MSINDKKEPNFHYTVNLPEPVDDILESDFWIFDNFSSAMLRSVTEPIKFSSPVTIFVKSGHCKADINLRTLSLQAPCILNIQKGEIMQPLETSEDFSASFMVFSQRFHEALYSHISNAQVLSAYEYTKVINLPDHFIGLHDRFFSELNEIYSEKDNPNRIRAILHTILAYYYRYIRQIVDAKIPEGTSSNRLSEAFLALVQKHFKQERFLSFYAEKMSVTPKHLSRMVKQQTGRTAVEWIERYVILEAKVLLKSSNLNIQQIAASLNFPTQSFFGKYFKTLTGMSPKEFRNTK